MANKTRDSERLTFTYAPSLRKTFLRRVFISNLYKKSREFDWHSARRSNVKIAVSDLAAKRLKKQALTHSRVKRYLMKERKK